MDLPGGESAEIRWDVRTDQIDLDRWGSLYLEVSRLRRKPPTSLSFPAVMVVVVLLLALLLVLTRDAAVLMGMAVIAAVACAVPLLRWAIARRLATKFKRVSALSDPFTFVADASGTQSASDSGSDRLAWSRYREALLMDDVMVLVLDTDAMRFLPTASLNEPWRATDAISTISDWIVRARALPGRSG